MDLFAFLAIGSLWRVVFADGSVLDEASCTSVVTNAPGVVTYSAPAAEVVIALRNVPEGLEMRGRVTPRGGTVTDFFLPARLRFSPDSVARVTFPGDKWMGTGYSLKDGFFRRQEETSRCSWEDVVVRGKGYRTVFGGGCSMRPLRDPPVPVRVTEEGAAFLGPGPVTVITNTLYAVNRASLRDHCERVLVDSPHGPLLSGSRLGGRGVLWRVGSASSVEGRPGRRALVEGCVKGVLRTAAGSSRRKVGLLRLPTGPLRVGFCPLSLEDLQEIVRKACREEFVYEELPTPAALSAALASDETLLIVNPYTEVLPVAATNRFETMLQQVRTFVRDGGQWLEVGGMSFCKALVPRRWHTLGGDYPGLFADFVHWRWKDGTASALMGLQPRPEHEPWRCPKPFVPGRLTIGADPQGGWVEHGFRAWATNGVTWTTPTVRLTKNRTLAQTCDEYVRDNKLARSLDAKVRDPGKLEKLKRAPLLFVGDSCAKSRRAIARIPVPSLVHQSQYLRGGFDKQYPDHLPPRADYGTAEEFRAFIRELRAAGHLFSPYTNPTWWCDHPRGPTFVAAGEAPLSLDEKGRPIYESYGKADGWTTCFWHPAVQAANRETRRQFTEDFPVDLLFQDQCGVRRRAYDFNPAAPHPTAYIEGVLSMVEEDSRIVPLATEDGWDRVAREQTALCGLSWGTVPIHDESWRQNVLTKVSLPAHLWEIEAVPTRLFHDTCLFYLHDLGGFARNERILAWCLALGYQLSYRCNAWHFLHDPKACAWYRRLHDLQSKVVSRYAGRKLLSFSHSRESLLARTDLPASAREDDGTVCATYEGDVRVWVNLGNVERVVGGRLLAPYGYFISAPGLTASALAGQAPAIQEETKK